MVSGSHEKFSFQSRLTSFKYAVRGILSAFRHQYNIRIQIAIAILAVLSGFYFSLSDVEWTVLILTIALVLSLEMINTAIEYLVNIVSGEYNPDAGRVKDIAAGAVLVAAIFALIIGLIIFIPKISQI